MKYSITYDQHLRALIKINDKLRKMHLPFLSVLTYCIVLYFKPNDNKKFK